MKRLLSPDPLDASAPRRGDVVALIPAFEPGMELVELVTALLRAGLPVVVVDDGSGAPSAPVFSAVAAMPRVRLLRHAINLGKGAALKTGLNQLAVERPDLVGVVTADADGQHRAEDVLAVAAVLAAHPAALVLGARKFDEAVPWRSRFGNLLTRRVMRWVSGQRVSDTQTGLRGIPAALVRPLLRLTSGGYEFELDMLLLCKYEGVAVREVAIRTVYVDGNRTSHFNPLRDSLRIYFVLLRFALVSLLSAVVDNLTFALAYHFGGQQLLAAQFCGRAVATLFNYLGNKTRVFHSPARIRSTLPKYLLLVAASGGLSYALIGLLMRWTALDVLPAKIVAESLLFALNFVVERDLVFARPEPYRRQ